MPINASRFKFFFIALALVFIDQIFKNAALAFLPMAAGQSGYLRLETYKNSGIAFGLPIPAGVFYFMVIVFLALAARVRLRMFENVNKREAIAFSLVLAGAAGNLIDRLRWGYVLDFVSIEGLLVFNLADMMIVAGTIIFLKKILIANKRPE